MGRGWGRSLSKYEAQHRAPRRNQINIIIKNEKSHGRPDGRSPISVGARRTGLGFYDSAHSGVV